MKDNKQASYNVNDATLDELVSIRGIGKKLAQQIIDLRPYEELHDLVNVSGINEKKLSSLLPYLTIKSKTQSTSLSKPTPKKEKVKPAAKVGSTEAFVFLEKRNEQEEAFLIVLGGFILGLIILLLRRSRN